MRNSVSRNNHFLVIGAGGMIGRALTNRLKQSGEKVWETTHLSDTASECCLFLDMTEDVSAWYPPDKIDTAFICAAVTSLDSCQSQPEKTTLFNVSNTLEVARKLAAKGVFIVFPSTNLVYDGSVPYRKAEEPVCPITEYGRQKAATEKQLLALGDCAAVVRLTKVLGPDMPLIRGWIESLQNGKVIYPFSNMVMAPLSLSFTVDVLMRVAGARLPGIVQVSAKEDVTYAQVAYYLAQRIGISIDLVQPISSIESGLSTEAIPIYTTLDNARLKLAYGLEPSDVWTTIDTVFGLPKFTS